MIEFCNYLSKGLSLDLGLRLAATTPQAARDDEHRFIRLTSARAITKIKANTYKTILLILLLSTPITTNVFARTKQYRLSKTGEVVKVAARAHSGVEEAIKKWSATIDYLSHSIDGYTFQLVPLVTFEEMRSVVKNNEVDFVLTNPTAYIDLSVKYKVARIATLINGRDKNGYTEFGGVVFVSADRHDINLLSDVKGQSIIGVHKEAFGGWQMVYRELLEIGIDPFNDCSKVLFSPDGTQEEVVYNVLQEKVDIGTVRTGILENMGKKGEIDLHDIKLIEPRADNFPLPHTTRLYPEWPFSVLKNTDEILAKKVAIALLQMEKDNPAAENGGYSGWKVPLSYDQVLLLLKTLKVSPFEDYGKITTKEYFKQNWPWLLLVCIAVLALFFVAIIVISLNRKLNARTIELEEARDGLDQKVREQTAKLVTEIDERKRAEQKLNKSNRLYATLSQVNQTIVREWDKQKLFQKICDIAIEFGKFRLAWIGLVDEENKLVRPVAFSGEGSDYLQNIKILLTGDNTGKGPTGRSIREGKSVVFNDLENNPDFVPWREKALEKGYRSSAAFPIRFNNRIIGALNIYAVEPHFFDKDEINLLEEATMDISFALENFEKEEKRKRVEQELLESEERFRVLYNNSPDMYVSVSPDDASILFCNETLLNKTGYSREEIIGFPIFKIYHNDCMEEVKKASQQFVATGVIQDKELILKRKDGSKIYVSLNVDAVRDEAGKILFSISSCRDITERRQAEMALRESEARLSTLMSNLPGMAYQCKNDEYWTILFVNDACEELTGYKPDQLIYNKDISYYELIHPDDRVFVKQRVEEALDAKEHFELEYRIISADGQEKWVWERGVQTTSQDHDPILLEGVIHDITKRKQAEDESQLRIKEIITINNAARKLQTLLTPDLLAQELISILEQIPFFEFGAVLLTDESTGTLIPFALSDQGRGPAFIEEDKKYVLNQGIPVGQGITGWVAQNNQSICLGDVRSDPRYTAMREDILSELCVPLCTENRVIGVLNVETTKADAYTEFDQHLLETIASQMAIAIQQSYLHEQIERQKSNLEQHVIERTTELQTANKKLEEKTKMLKKSQKSLVLLLEDVNESRAELDRSNKKLEISNKELEAFSYSVSHDLRAPLRAIDGFTGILMEDYAEKLDDEGQRIGSVIQHNAEKMGQLVDDLLTFSRLGRASLTYSTIEMQNMANAMYHELTTSDDRKRIKFTVTDLATVKADATLMRQVWTNLISNAIKFSSKRKQSVIAVTCRKDDSKLTYQIEDNGAGFNMKYKDKLFGVFQRLHSEKEFAGTGVGLALVQRIINRHDGEVWADGQVEQGAKFYFSLPVIGD